MHSKSSPAAIATDRGLGPRAGDRSRTARRAGAGLRLPRRRHHHPQRWIARGRLHLRPAQRPDARRFRRAPDPARILRRKFPFLTPTSPLWPSPDATPPPAKAGKPGSASTGRRKPPARRASRWSRRCWSSFSAGTSELGCCLLLGTPAALFQTSPLWDDLTGWLTPNPYA